MLRTRPPSAFGQARAQRRRRPTRRKYDARRCSFGAAIDAAHGARAMLIGRRGRHDGSMPALDARRCYCIFSGRRSARRSETAS